MKKGFSLIELLMVLVFLGVATALSFPAWRALLDSGARRTGEARVMDALEHARSESISSGREVWVVLRHQGDRGSGTGTDSVQDAFRIVAKGATSTLTMGGWSRLPAGVVFHPGEKAIPDARPPGNILEAVGGDREAGAVTGAVMFLRSGSVGWPRPGGESLTIPLDCKKGRAVITLSRGTGRASLAE